MIRSINGQPIYESSDLPPIIGAMAPGSKVTVELLRDGKPRTVSATLNALDERVADADQGEDEDAPRAGAAAQANPFGIVGEDLVVALEHPEALGAHHEELPRVVGGAIVEREHMAGICSNVGLYSDEGAAAFGRDLRPYGACQGLVG